MQLKLISFASCPFVQRAVITLLFKKVPYDIEYIDLGNKPDWFLKISPRGKVPVLMADDTPLFESQAICEFLEETHPSPSILPADPVGKARDRAWFALASEDLLMPIYRYSYTSDKTVSEETRSGIVAKLDRLETELAGKEFLSASGHFGMADIGMAPFLYRAEFYKKRGWDDLFADFPNVARWSAKVVAPDYVQNSVPEVFATQVDEKLTEIGSYLLTK